MACTGLSRHRPVHHRPRATPGRRRHGSQTPGSSSQILRPPSDAPASQSWRALVRPVITTHWRQSPHRLRASQKYAQSMASNGARAGVHPPNEQYLEAIFNLEEEGSQVIQARLAERVGHSAPTVSEMVHRLREAGYIEVTGRSLSLTPDGRATGHQRHTQAPLGRTAPHRHHRPSLAQGPRRGRPLGARHLRRRRGPAGGGPGQPRPRALTATPSRVRGRHPSRRPSWRKPMSVTASACPG